MDGAGFFAGGVEEPGGYAQYAHRRFGQDAATIARAAQKNMHLAKQVAGGVNARHDGASAFG